MKILGIEFPFGKHFLTEPKETWLVINTGETRNYYGSLTTIETCPAKECYSEQEAIDYIKEYIPKGRWKFTRVYKEIIPNLN